jgi:DNA-binding transcriptional MerR regulator
VPDDRDNVIHVVFGKDGTSHRPAKREVQAAPKVEADRSDPLTNLYDPREVARVLGLAESRVRYWDRSGFLKPSGRAGKRRFYTFQDLIGMRVAKSLMDQGVPLRRVRKSLESLRDALPKIVRPLAELRVIADGQSVVVKSEDGSFEPTTGQLVIDFDVQNLREDVVRMLLPKGPGGEQKQRAYDLYLEGCRLDEDSTTSDRAEACYRRALELDPSLSNALTNLGNIRFRSGFSEEAETLYRQALEVDPDQPEAHYNLGFLAYERGDVADAASEFAAALGQDSGFADAHFNLAMALEELGRSADARKHWRAYLALDPTGPWAEVARRHLTQHR